MLFCPGFLQRKRQPFATIVTSFLQVFVRGVGTNCGEVVLSGVLAGFRRSWVAIQVNRSHRTQGFLEGVILSIRYCMNLNIPGRQQ